MNFSAPAIVRLGVHNKTIPEPSTVDFTVKRIIFHPAYKRRTKHNDIALIELDGNVKFRPNIRPACLPQSNVQPKQLMASGWGSLSFGGRSSDVLLKVDLPFVDMVTCEEKLESILSNFYYDSQICYGGEEGKDSCQGDSGGPLQAISDNIYCSYIVYGITSYGNGCGNSIPAIYTKVWHYIDWIEENVWPNA